MKLNKLKEDLTLHSRRHTMSQGKLNQNSPPGDIPCKIEREIERQRGDSRRGQVKEKGIKEG